MSDGVTFNIGKVIADQNNMGQNVTATQNIYGNDGSVLGDVVYHIIGEESFGLFDAVALKSAGAKTVVVSAYVDPFFEILKADLERSRSDNAVIPYWHFSGHCSIATGLEFGDQLVSWKVFSDLISPYDNLEILFLAACSSIDVADAVSGPFEYVLACVVDIPDQDAAKATQVFWKNIVRGKDAEEAFEAVKLNVPNYAPHLRLRGLR